MDKDIIKAVNSIMKDNYFKTITKIKPSETEIFLVHGLEGSGKSTFIEVLSRFIKVNYIDTYKYSRDFAEMVHEAENKETLNKLHGIIKFTPGYIQEISDLLKDDSINMIECYEPETSLMKHLKCKDLLIINPNQKNIYDYDKFTHVIINEVLGYLPYKAKELANIYK